MYKSVCGGRNTLYLDTKYCIEKDTFKIQIQVTLNNLIKKYLMSHWQKCVLRKVTINRKISAPWPNLFVLKVRVPREHLHILSCLFDERGGHT